MKAIRRFTVRTALPERINALGELAHNLRWSWHVPTQDLFASIDAEGFAAARGEPGRFLAELGPERLQALADDQAFVERVQQAQADLHTYLSGDRWYQGLADPKPASIAYFSPEYGITAALPQYSGGLGILAGDHLKAASDLGVPIVGVGLFYRSGYFKQALTADGWQTETYPVLDPDGLPMSLLTGPDGTPCEININLPGGQHMIAHVWKVDVGRVTLLLLDSDVPANDDATKAVTHRLYGGGGDNRLKQELLLGIGGVRALRLWSELSGAPAPEVFHTNEGHAGFLGLERIRECMGQGFTFDEAVEAARAATIFTTHTPVPAGIDRFEFDQVKAHLGEPGLLDGVPIDRVLFLGIEDYQGGSPGIFNMAVMGFRLAKRANGVAQLHGKVSREMFSGLWPGFDAEEVPIISITNGVHAPTWVDRKMRALARRHHCSLSDTSQSTHEGSNSGWDGVDQASDQEIWDVMCEMRADLVRECRTRTHRSMLRRGKSPAELGWVESVLDPNVLTIGFARRVPTYKRLTLMLSDPERLKRLLLHPERPIQLIIAGKSHPADDQGKRLIQELVHFADDPQVRHRLVFLPNYDMAMASSLYPGCDVWLNNPLRPLEACGTSGMKAALNGALNLSILDGWWDEMYDGENGWAIPTADGVSDPERRDDLEAAALYGLLEDSVTRRFYERDENGVPTRWVAQVRHTLRTLGPKVQATRMVADYVDSLYLPAAQSGRDLGADLQGAKELAHWKERVRGQWDHVRVDHVESTGIGNAPQIGEILRVNSFVSLGELSPNDVDVQVVFGKVTDADTITGQQSESLKHVESYEAGRHQFSGDIALRQTGQFGYSVRILPKHHLLNSPAEVGLVANA